MTHVVLKLGSEGQQVEELQELLKKRGFLKGPVDGDFGPLTQTSLMAFQKSRDEVSDGVAGERTWSALKGTAELSWRLRESAYIRAAEDLDCDIAAIKAVSEVESGGDGFLEEGVPKILFERHWMYRKLDEYSLSTALMLAEEHLPHIVNKTPGGYCGSWGEHTRFNEAYGYNHEAAIESTSWGRFQIMGFHFDHLGYSSAEEFRIEMSKSENTQLKAFVKFIKADNRLWSAIRKKDWKKFAYAYNGPNYEINSYDKKMSDAYKRLTK